MYFDSQGMTLHMKLTICIPTYDRIELLLKNIRPILSQLNQNVGLIIIDNASIVSVEDVIKNAYSNVELVHVRFIRNKFNVGGNVNVVRCIEECDGDWAWIIGDDDLLRNDAVEIVLRAIADYPTASIINFPNNGKIKRNITRKSVGREKAIRDIDDFWNFLFLPSTVFRLEHMHSQICWGYQYAYTCAPHIVIWLLTTNQQSIFVWMTNNLLEDPKLEEEVRGSCYVIYHGLPALLDLNLKSNEISKLREKLSCNLGIGTLLIQSYADVKYNDQSRLFSWRRYNNAIISLARISMLKSIAAFFLGFLLVVPVIGDTMICFLYFAKTGRFFSRKYVQKNRL